MENSGLADVESFLKAAKMSQYLASLRELGYDTFEALEEMDEKHMLEAGLRPGHCLLLRRMLRERISHQRCNVVSSSAKVLNKFIPEHISASISDVSTDVSQDVIHDIPKVSKPYRDRVAVIGAGPSGTSVLRAFRSAQEKGARIPEIVCYEKQSEWGGLWNFSWRTGLDEFGEPVHNSQYRHLWSNGPKECLEFADYSFEEHFGKTIPSFPPREVLRDYIVGRMERSGVKPWVRFSTVVRDCVYDKKSEMFTVRVHDRNTGSEVTESFSHVCVCSGHFSVPNVPHFQGMESFTGRCIHAHDFRSAEEFAGMRLLVVGTSYSAEDIASQCYKYGVKSVHCSWRTQPMNFRWPSNFTTVPLLVKVEGRTCTFKDGSKAEIDAIILCTGYIHHFPFMHSSLRLKTANRLWIDKLHNGVVWPDQPKLFYIGMQDQWFTFNMFDAQSWWVRDVILGRIVLPSRSVMDKEWQQWRDKEDNLDGTDESRIRFQADYVKSLILQTDYPTFDIDGVVRTFLEWEHNKHQNIMTFRDKSHRSLMSGKMSPTHHAPWLKAFDDSIECYVKPSSKQDGFPVAGDRDIVSLKHTIEMQEAELRALRSKLSQSDEAGSCGLSAGVWSDLVDLLSASIWLLGCVCFLPAFLDFLAWGCLFFMIGELGYIAIGLRCLREALRGPGIRSSLAWEGIGCAFGGTSFFVGTILFLPDQLEVPTSLQVTIDTIKAALIGPSFLLNLPGDAEDKIETAGATFEGALYFIAGSLGFSFSSFFCAMGLHTFGASGDRFAVASAILHMGGGLLFCVGSVGFLSQVGCGNRMVAFGSWSFICGCVLFIFGAFAALCRHCTGTRVKTIDHKLESYREPLLSKDSR